MTPEQMWFTMVGCSLSISLVYYLIARFILLRPGESSLAAAFVMWMATLPVTPLPFDVGNADSPTHPLTDGVRALYAVATIAALALSIAAIPAALRPRNGEGSQRWRRWAVAGVVMVVAVVVMVVVPLVVTLRPSSDGLVGPTGPWVAAVFNGLTRWDRWVAVAWILTAAVGAVPFMLFTIFGMVFLPMQVFWLWPMVDEKMALMRKRCRAEEEDEQGSKPLINSKGSHQSENDEEKSDGTTLYRQFSTLISREEGLEAIAAARPTMLAKSAVYRPRILLGLYRILVGVVIVSLVLILVVAMGMSNVNALVSSTCGSSCAYALPEENIGGSKHNALVQLLRRLTYPANVVAVVLIMAYAIAATWTAMAVVAAKMGAPVGWRRTSLASLIVLSAAASTAGVAFAVEMNFAAQQYVTFGSQTVLPWSDVPCDVFSMGHGATCTVAWGARLVDAVALSDPTTAVVVMAAGLASLLCGGIATMAATTIPIALMG